MGHLRIEYSNLDGGMFALDRYDFGLQFVLAEARKMHTERPDLFPSIRVANREGIVWSLGARRTVTVKVKVGAHVDRWVTGRGGRNLYAVEADRCRERLAAVWGRENVRFVVDTYPMEDEKIDPDMRLLDVDMPPSRTPASANVVSIFKLPMAFGGS